MSAPETHSSRDERLAHLLQQLLEMGPGASIEAACREHPELADELRSLWATAQVAGLIAAAASDGSVDASGDGLTPPRSSGSFFDD
jgi:hypothetical protein